MRHALCKRLMLWLLPSLLAAAGLAQLGRWQLQRAADKQTLLTGIEEAHASGLVEFATLDPRASLRFRAVRVRGEFIADRQVLLDNQMRAGQPGVRVYVPLRLSGTRLALLVDRGWLARPDRSAPLPQLNLPAGEVLLNGLLLDPPGGGILLGAAANDWPRLLTRIDLSALEPEIGLPLLDCVLEDLHTPRGESIRAGMLPPERHRGYALQWFGLSLTVLILYGVLAMRSWRAANRPSPP
ncbi:MAG: SURF1 family protein [Xanthomonadales bacterium]|nr:SURF1 family protein [Xanthomonadales bacterium]MCE7931380.1 SURF1 family protein [Xanthomonadales bacterium PRO6]